MATCRDIETTLRELAARPPRDLPPAVRDHLAVCPACVKALATARLARGLVATAADGEGAPEGFAGRVMAALPAATGPRRVENDLWRPAWGLLPAFAATAAALLLLFQASVTSAPAAGLVPAEGLSAAEHLVLDVPQPDPDLLLAALLEGGAR